MREDACVFWEARAEVARLKEWTIKTWTHCVYPLNWFRWNIIYLVLPRKTKQFHPIPKFQTNIPEQNKSKSNLVFPLNRSSDVDWVPYERSFTYFTTIGKRCFNEPNTTDEHSFIVFCFPVVSRCFRGCEWVKDTFWLKFWEIMLGKTTFQPNAGVFCALCWNDG